MTLRALFVTLSAWLVPADQRAEWRREWLAELHARPASWASLRFAMGAPVHALWLRLEPWWPGLLSVDVAFGWRFLRRRPGFALPAVATLALGIGATTAGFSVVYGVLFKPLPYRDPSRIVQLWETNPRFGWTEATIAPGNLLSWRERNTVFSEMAWYFGSDTRQSGVTSVTLGGGDPIRGRGLSVSANFFTLLGARAALGRALAEGDDVPGRHRVVVLADAFWRRQFGGDPGAVGGTITMNGISFVVAGVMPATFRFDRVDTEFWIPLALDWAQLREVRRPHWMRAMARLKPGVTVEQARADLTRMTTDLEREHPDTNTQMGAGLGPLDDWFVGPSRQSLLLLLAAMGLILVSACANVANLLLARTRERIREMSLRAALGASRLRLARQLLIETAIVSAAGTVLGIALALSGVRLVIAAAPAGLPRQDDIGLDPVVLLFAAGIGVAAAFAVGILPALRATRGDFRAVLADGGRVTSHESRRLHRSFVAVQVALAAVLLGGATLTLRSFSALNNVDPGFPVDGLVTARVSLSGASYREAGKAAAFFEELTARLGALPDVTGAGATRRLPLEGSAWTSQFFIEGQPEFKGTELRHKTVTPGYLEALGLRLIAGRTIDATDRTDAPAVVVVNETLVRRYLPGVNPIGQRLTLNPPGPTAAWRTIVGVVGDERQDGLGVATRPEVYESIFQEESSDLAVVVRSGKPIDQVIGDIRRTVRDLDPQVAVYDAGTFADRLDRSMLGERVAAWLAAVFAVIGLVLSSVGTYGIAARAVVARTREIGVRVACGATARDVVRMILRDHLRVAVVGLLVGVPLVLLSAQVLVSLLYGVRAFDPVSLAASIVFPLAAAVVACVVPARRALRVNPVSALRADG